MKKTLDLKKFQNTLPYASEIFGIYQPLLGWQSKRTQERIDLGNQKEEKTVLEKIKNGFDGSFEVKFNEDGSISQDSTFLSIAAFKNKKNLFDSFLLTAISEALPELEECTEEVWRKKIERGNLQDLLDTIVKTKCIEWYNAKISEIREKAHATTNNADIQQNEEKKVQGLLADQLNYESVLAGYLFYLLSNEQYEKLKEVFFNTRKGDLKNGDLIKQLQKNDPFDAIDPKNELDKVSLSPIGIVHLFRQYFFEFDTFLGSPVGHIWLSPGSTVELVEISTRRTLTERIIENSFETIVKSEKSITEQEEISDAVKEENKSDTKFGTNTSANKNWVTGSISASSNLSMDKTQQKSREETHKKMRQQTEKLSTEIRKNFKSTFKTITEITDTSSKRYIMSNNTAELVNYELRRKMRQVGVQVQDIGTYLCWQTYVDDPGKQLGISQLVHIAKSPDTSNIPDPEKIPMPRNIITTETIIIPFVQDGDTTADKDEDYQDGREVDNEEAFGAREYIQYKFPNPPLYCNQPGFVCNNISVSNQENNILIEEIKNDVIGEVTFVTYLKKVNFKGQNSITVPLILEWIPSDEMRKSIEAENAKHEKGANESRLLDFKKEFVNAARERIKLASNIESRKFEILREEERIVVYRSLIQDLLTKNIPIPDDKTRHVVAELINSIFDVDKMLYFVAPEWWRPRLHQSKQTFGGLHTPKSVQNNTNTEGNGQTSNFSERRGQLFREISSEFKGRLLKEKMDRSNIRDVKSNQPTGNISNTDISGWGGIAENRPDNYYITEESSPAKFGSSLGWLLQLDGDDLRNAFLNAPWVKAVIPVRPGKEQSAINWLQSVNVEGTDGLESEYIADVEELEAIRREKIEFDPLTNPDAPVTITDAINHLCRQVTRKHEISFEVGKEPKDALDDKNKVSTTPLDKVYEHGFYALQGGFRANVGAQFEVFDQWTEIMPTDQVVAVEVKYDPKTGKQI